MIFSFDRKFDGNEHDGRFGDFVQPLPVCGRWLGRLAWLVAETFRLALCLARQALSRNLCYLYLKYSVYRQVELFKLLSAIAFPILRAL